MYICYQFSEYTMKKALILFLIISNKVLFAQFGQITSVQIIPANPTDADQVKAVVQVMLGGSPCNLNNAVSNITGNNIELDNYYCEGMLTMICNRTDTINLGTLSAGTYNLIVNMWTGCGPYTTVDSALNNSFNVSTFSKVSKINTSSNNLIVFPNPSANGEILLQIPNNNIYSIICYDGVGKEVFSSSNISGIHKLKLPDTQGFYYIKAVDNNGSSEVIKVMHAPK